VRVHGRWAAGLGVAAVVACGGRANKSDPDDGQLGGASGEIQGPGEGAGGGMDATNTGGRPGTAFGAGGLSFSSSSGGFSFTSQSCPAGSYDPDPDDDTLECQPWTDCAPGSYIATFGSPEHDHVCVPCTDGFTVETNQRSCAPWTLCGFHQLEASPATPTADRTCKPKDGFPVYNDLGGYYYSYSHRSGPLTVTPQGTHQLVDQYSSYEAQYTSIIRYTPEGELNVLAEGRQIADMAALGQDLVLVGWNLISDSTEFSEIGYVQRRTPTGNIPWQHPLATADKDHWSHARVAVFDDEIYVVSRIVELDCKYDASGGGVVCNDDPGSQIPRVALQVFNSQGQGGQEITLDEDTSITGILDMTVASDGQIYVALTRAVPAEPPESCENIDETSDYYEIYCLNAKQDETAVLEFSPAGDQQGEHVLGLPLAPVVKLMPTTEDTVYALARPRHEPKTRLLRLGASGQKVLDKELPDWVQTFTTISDGLFFVGPLTFGYADAAGTLTDVTEETGYKPFEAIDVAVGPEGTLMVAGGYGYLGFVRPWPDE